MSTLISEIHEQPAVLQALLDQGWGPVERAAAAIRAAGPHSIYLAARGTSEHAGIYGQYILGAYAGLPVALAAPSLFTIYGRPPRLAGSLVAGISQSGQSPDIIAVVAEGRRQGALTLAITNSPGSPLATAADHHLAVGAGVERSVAATKSYTAELLTLAMLAAALSDAPGLRAELAVVPEAVRAALGEARAAADAAGPLVSAERAVVLGRGYQLATAMEWSLKLKELTYLLADRYSTAEFQHGPIALVEPGFPVLAVAPADSRDPDTPALLRRLVAERRADLILLSDDDELLALTPYGIRLPAGVPGWLMPIVAIAPAQLLCVALARARGLDPDAPRGLSKVTRTR